MTEESIILESSLEATEESNDFEIDAALNSLAMNTLTFMNEEVSSNDAIPAGDQAYVMLHAAEAVSFNIIMHIAESTGTDPLEIANKTKDNLIEAIHSLSHGDGCCGHSH